MHHNYHLRICGQSLPMIGLLRKVLLLSLVAAVCRASGESLRNRQDRRLGYQSIAGLYEPVTIVTDQVSFLASKIAA